MYHCDCCNQNVTFINSTLEEKEELIASNVITLHPAHTDKKRKRDCVSISVKVKKQCVRK
jgi:hypothetical protein